MTTLRPYPAYKPSGVDWLGDIPGGWERHRLKRLARLNPSKSEVVGMDDAAAVTFVPMEKLGTDGRVDKSETRPFGEVKSGLTYFAEGDVILAKITPCFENGKSAVAESIPGGFAFGSTEYHVMRPTAALDASYLYRLVSSKPFLLIGEEFMEGSAGQKRVPTDFLANFSIPLPPLDEQRAIAAFLDAMDERVTHFIAARRRMIALLEEQKQAIITQAVTKGLDPDVPTKPSGVDWLGDVPAHWEVRRFKHLARINSGQVDPREEEYKSEVLIAPNHIAKNAGQLLNLETAADQGADSGKYTVQTGQVIYSKIRPYLRKAAIAPFDCLCSADMYPITPDPVRMNTSFFLRALLSPTSTRYIVDASLRARMPKVNREALGELWLAYPSLDEQKQIVDHIERETILIKETVVRNEREIDLIQEYRTRLIADVVTGKLDVRVAAADDLPTLAPSDQDGLLVVESMSSVEVADVESVK